MFCKNKTTHIENYSNEYKKFKQNITIQVENNTKVVKQYKWVTLLKNLKSSKTPENDKTETL